MSDDRTSEAELRSGEFRHHGPHCTDLQPVSWPGNQCLWGPFRFGAHFFGAKIGRDFWAEFWIILSGETAGGLVLRRSCVGATGAMEASS